MKAAATIEENAQALKESNTTPSGAWLPGDEHIHGEFENDMLLVAELREKADVMVQAEFLARQTIRGKAA